MPIEASFRLLFLTLALAFLVVRNSHRVQMFRRQDTRILREGWGSRLFGGMVIGVGWFFSTAYLIAPDWPGWAYSAPYPLWLRVLGALTMGGAVVLLAWTHHHLGPNYHPLVCLHSEQTLVVTGPYGWVQHPMYSAFLFFDIGCGCLSANLVLTLVLPALLVIHIALRLGPEEKLLKEHFGAAYEVYVHKTPRFFPHFTSMR